MSPFMAFCILLIAGITALLIIVGFRKKVSGYGEICREAFAERYRHSYQAITGIKEIDVMQRQDDFVNYYKIASERACVNNTRYLCITKVPSRLIEFVFISGMILLVYICMGRSGDITALVTQFGALAVASVRILPSISNITNSMNSLVYYRLTLEAASENIKSIDSQLLISEENERKTNNQYRDTFKFKQAVVIDNIDWRYTKERNYVLKNLSLTITKGESVAFIGESGAGKTTLADIILGLFHPQSGSITVDGTDIFSISNEWAKMIGYVPQTVFLIDDTIRNNISFGIPEEQIDEQAIQQAIEQAQLKDMVDKLPQGLDTVLGERGAKISGGQRQRIAIARALYYNPDILVLDEATSALDTETENAVMESIEALQGKKTLIIVAHRLSTVAKCDRIYEIKNGKAFMRKKEEILNVK